MARCRECHYRQSRRGKELCWMCLKVAESMAFSENQAIQAEQVLEQMQAHHPVEPPHHTIVVEGVEYEVVWDGRYSLDILKSHADR